MSEEADRERRAMLARVLSAPAGRPDESAELASAAAEPQSLADVLNNVLDRGVVVGGDVVLSVAGVDLVLLKLSALLTSVSTMRELEARGRSRAAREPAGEIGPVRREPREEKDLPGSADQSKEIPPPTSRPTPQGGDAAAGSQAGREAADSALAAQLGKVAPQLPEKLDIDPESVQRDLARLVLTIVELLRRVVEHQAVRRMDDPDLTEERIERMGIALQQLSARMDDLRSIFGLAAEDLNIDLGPLGRLL
jgi:hypothetical protein